MTGAGIRAIADAHRRGETTPLQLFEDFLARRDPEDHVFTVLCGRARDQAAESTRRWLSGRPIGVLDGLLVAVKDSMDVAGLLTSNGSLVDAARTVASADADIVRGLLRHGVVVVGKTNQSELAFSGLGLNPHFGSPANPLGLAEPRVPGGSSSGSAVAVALGAVPLALGTDTSGSVRVPAAFCGVVGYKSTESRFSLTGVRPLSTTLDSIGFLTRDVADLQLVLDQFTGASSGSGRVRFVVPEDDVVTTCDDEVRSWFNRQIGELADLGTIDIETRALPVLREAQDVMDAHGTLVAAEAYARYGHLLDDATRPRLDPSVARRLRLAASISRVDVVRTRMRSLRGRIASELAGALLLCPTVRHAPPLISEVMASGEDFDQVNARTLRTTMVLSYLGMPGITVPRSDGRRLGLGLLVSGPRGSDRRVLRAAGAIDDREDGS